MRYVKAGIFPRELGSAINNAELVRHVSDYDDFYVADRNETIRQMELAERVIFMVERYCIDRINRGLV